MRQGARDIDDASGSLGDAMHGLRHAVAAMAIGTVAAVGAAQVIVRAQVPRYAASATLLVRAPSNPEAQPGRAQLTANPAFENSEMENQLAVLRSERLVRGVHATLGPRTQGMTVDDFAGGLTVRRLGSSNVMEVTYTSLSPEDAARFANAITAGYLKQRVDGAFADAAASRLTSRMDGIEAQARVAEDAVRQGRSPMGVLGDADALVLDSAVTPSDPVSPQKNVSLLFAAILGGLVPAGIAMMRGIVNPLLRSEQDSTRLIGLPCLGRLAGGSQAPSVEERRTAAELLARRLRRPGRATRIGIVSIGPAALLDDVGALTTAFTAPDVSLLILRTPSARSREDIALDGVVFALRTGETHANAARSRIALWQRAGWPVAGVLLIDRRQARPTRRWPAHWLAAGSARP